MNPTLLDRILYLLYALLGAGVITCLALIAAEPATTSAAGRGVVTTTAAARQDRPHPDRPSPCPVPTMTITSPQQTAGSDSDRT